MSLRTLGATSGSLDGTIDVADYTGRTKTHSVQIEFDSTQWFPCGDPDYGFVGDALVTFTDVPSASLPRTPSPSPSPLPPPPPPPWALVLSATPPVGRVGDATTLTAIADRSVSGTGYAIEIYDQDTGALVKACTSGLNCSATVRRDQAGTVTYLAYVAAPSSTAPPPDIQATSNRMSVIWADTSTPPSLPPWAMVLSATPPATTTGSTVMLAATVDQSVSGTDYAIEIFNQDSGELLATCVTGFSCQATVDENEAQTDTFVAYVAPPGTTRPPANIQATSNEAQATWR